MRARTAACFRVEHLIYQPVYLCCEKGRNGFPQPSSITPKNGKEWTFTRLFLCQEYRSRSAAFESRVGEGLILTTVIERKDLSPWYSPFSSFLAVTFAWISYLVITTSFGICYIYRIDDNSMIHSWLFVMCMLEIKI